METVKENWKYWLKSSVQTFLAVALPILVVDLKELSFQDLQLAGWLGGLLVIVRLAVKAGWYGLIALISWIAIRFEK